MGEMIKGQVTLCRNCQFSVVFFYKLLLSKFLQVFLVVGECEEALSNSLTNFAECLHHAEVYSHFANVSREYLDLVRLITLLWSKRRQFVPGSLLKKSLGTRLQN